MPSPLTHPEALDTMTRFATCIVVVLAVTLTMTASAAAATPGHVAEPASAGAHQGAAGEDGNAPAVAPANPPASVLEALRGRRGPVPKQAPPTLLTGGKPAGEVAPDGMRAAGEPFYSWGVTKYQSGLNCSIIDAPYYETQVTSQVGYGGTTTVPRVGERFNVVLLYSHPGYACSGGFLADLYTELNLPEGAQPAVDENNGIRCFTTTREDPDTWVNVTNNTWSTPNGLKGNWCKTDGATGSRGGINLGLRMMVTGTMFQIVVPVIATKELKGAANVPTVAKFQGTTESVVTTSRLAYPEVWANVLNFFTPEISYPTPSATEVTPFGAKTTAYVYNHFKDGNAYIDIGPTTAYGTSTNAIPLGNFDAYTINANWPLLPGRTYHWRARFVDGSGNVTLGPDQTFVTPAGSIVSKSGSAISVRAGGRTNDNLRISSGGGVFRFTNPAAPLAPGAGCVAVTANEVTCAATGVRSITADTGWNTDTITVDPGVTVATRLLGGPGDDTLTAGSGADVIDGGPGADVITGGAGSDLVTYATRTATQPVGVTLDAAANDGGSLDVSGTRKDDVRPGVERIYGGAGADTLVGNAGNNVLRGGGGADTLRGMSGADQLVTNDDVVDATIDCGLSLGDRATVDASPSDPATTGCESVTKV